MDILEKYLKTTKKVEIEFIVQNQTTKTFKTGFYKILEDKYVIYRPQNNETFEQNQKLRVFIYTQSGIFIFDSNIITLNSKLIEIQKPKNYSTLQRRELLRAELNVPFCLIFENAKKQKYITQNISGSGFSFYCDEIFDKCENYKVELDFEDRKITSKIKIIEIRKNLKTNLPKYRYSVSLVSLNQSDENYIVKQCIINNIQMVNI